VRYMHLDFSRECQISWFRRKGVTQSVFVRFSIRFLQMNSRNIYSHIYNWKGTMLFVFVSWQRFKVFFLTFCCYGGRISNLKNKIGLEFYHNSYLQKRSWRSVQWLLRYLRWKIPRVGLNAYLGDSNLGDYFLHIGWGLLGFLRLT
jgi:hypothetical protein